MSATVIRWLFYQAWRLYSLVKWRLSRRIGTMAYDKRQQACAACEGLVKVGDKRFCGPCGCRHWKWADLRIKNEREEHNCPWAKHDGSYQTKGGCSSCSGGPKSNGKQTAPQARR